TAMLGQVRQEAEAAVRRNDELDAQLLALREENDRLYQNRNAAADDHGRALEALRRDATMARAERDAEQARTTTVEAARGDLERRLADVLRERTALQAKLYQLEADGVPNVARRVGQLAEQLQQAQEANERLRSFLAVVG